MKWSRILWGIWAGASAIVSGKQTLANGGTALGATATGGTDYPRADDQSFLSINHTFTPLHTNHPCLAESLNPALEMLDLEIAGSLLHRSSDNDLPTLESAAFVLKAHLKDLYEAIVHGANLGTLRQISHRALHLAQLIDHADNLQPTTLQQKQLNQAALEKGQVLPFPGWTYESVLSVIEKIAPAALAGQECQRSIWHHLGLSSCAPANIDWRSLYQNAHNTEQFASPKPSPDQKIHQR